MLVLLSPAKKLNENRATISGGAQPKFIDEAQKLIDVLKKKSPKQIKELMKLSDSLAELNVERYQSWSTNTSEKSKSAVLLFDGEVYSGLDAENFSKAEMNYAQDHLRLLSGLYGVLKPTDLVDPYRLEMGTKLKVAKHNNLYEFWGDKVVNEINSLLDDQKERVLINLASNEYFKVVNKKKLDGKVIVPVFKDFSKGQYKTVMVYAKKARGMMANFIIKNKIEKVEDLKAFDIAGYCFNADASTENELVFLRG